MKNIVNTKSTSITKKKISDLKAFENSYFLFPNSPSIMFINKKIKGLLSKLSVSNSKVDTLAACLREVVSDHKIDKQY